MVILIYSSFDKSEQYIMDNHHTRKDDTFNLSLQGTSIQPGTTPLRPSSARFNSQLKQPTTPPRGGDTTFKLYY